MSQEIEENGSDISSDSSWTLVNRSAPISRNISQETLCCGKEQLDIIAKDILEEPFEKPENVVETDFQFLPEERPKKKMRKVKKDYDYRNLLTLIACLFTLTGLSLFTALLPQTFVQSVDIDNFQPQLENVYKDSEKLNFDNLPNHIRATKDAINLATSMDLLHKISEEFDEDFICDANITPFSNNSFPPKQMQEFKIQISSPLVKETELESTLGLDNKILKHTKMLLVNAKSLIKSPSFHMFMATIVQDLCLIKLINEFLKRSKTTNGSEEVKKVTKSSKVAMNLPIKKKNRKSRVETKSKKPVKNGLNDMQMSLGELNKTLVKDENGKSECERRFAELDCKWSSLGENHRQNVMQIKNAFKDKMLQLKEKEKESLTRREKIGFLREKFIQRLKTDRETYLRRLKKLRDEKQVALHQICHNFKRSRDFGSKDVSVGNFAVVLPNEYSFEKKIIDMKQKELNGHRNLTMETVSNFSYVPFCANTSSVPLDDVTEKTQKASASAKEKSKKLYRKKKQQTKNDAEEVKEVVANIVASLSKSLLKTESHVELSLNNTNLPAKTTVNKRSLSNLYDAAFEFQSKKIKRRDFLKWNKKYDDDFKWTNANTELSKQDPSKTHKQKIIHKGVL